MGIINKSVNIKIVQPYTNNIFIITEIILKIIYFLDNDEGYVLILQDVDQ